MAALQRPVSGGGARVNSPLPAPAPDSSKSRRGTTQPNHAWHDVLELCKKGFANKMESLADHLISEVRAELRQGTAQLCGDFLEKLSHREHALDGTLKILTEKLDTLEGKVADPVTSLSSPREGHDRTCSERGVAALRSNDDLQPVLERLQHSETMQKAATKQTELQLERLTELGEQLSRSSGSLLNSLRCLEQQVQQLEGKMHSAEGKISNVLGQQQSLSSATSQLTKEMQQMQQQDVLAFAELQSRLQRQVEELQHSQALCQDVSSMKQDLQGFQQQEELDFKTVVSEIARVQQALHLDFVKVLQEDLGRKLPRAGSRLTQAKKTSSCEDAQVGSALGSLLKAPGSPSSSRSKSPSPFQDLKRFRDWFAQTDPLPRKEAHCQTESSLYLDSFAPKDQRKRESRHSNKPMLEETASRQFGGGEEQFREKARAAAMKPPYSVYDYYHETGCCQAIAKHPHFETVTLALVFLNACWMAVDIDLNPAVLLIDSHLTFVIVENVFCGYFFLELLIRFGAFERKCDAFRDLWFISDLFLSFLYVLDTWVVTILVVVGGVRLNAGTSSMTILRMLRMVRLCRLTRLAKLLRAVPELVIIMKGIGFAARSVAVFFIFWTLITYAFSIAIRQLTDKTEVGNTYFATVPETMNILLLQGLFPESIQLLDAISDGSTWYLWPLTVFFLALVSLTVMYMLVGVLVEVVQVVSSVERESLSVTFMASEMRYELKKLGFQPDGPISKSDFQRAVVEPPIARIVHAVGVDVVMLCDMLDLLFEEVEKEGMLGMPFAMLIENILSMRGSNPARVKDCVEQIKMFKLILHERNESLMKKLKREFDTLKLDMTDMKDDLKDLREAEVREKQMKLMRPPEDSD